jgi:hypothetical protein
MEFLILLGMCTLTIAAIAWFGRRRQPDHRATRYGDISAAALEQRQSGLARAEVDRLNRDTKPGF